MDEANHRLPQAPAISQAQRTALAVIARRAAIRETKAEMQRQGLKPMYTPVGKHWRDGRQGRR